MKLPTKRNFIRTAFAMSILSVSFAVASCGDDTSEDVTFSDVESVFKSNCIGCHETGENYAPVFSGYDGVKDKAMNGALLDRIQSDTAPMPPAGKMAAEDIQVFIDWADGGYLE